MSHTGIFVIVYTLSVGKLQYFSQLQSTAAQTRPLHGNLHDAQKFFSFQQAEVFLSGFSPNIRAYYAIMELYQTEIILHCPELTPAMQTAV